MSRHDWAAIWRYAHAAGPAHAIRLYCVIATVLAVLAVLVMAIVAAAS